MTTASLLLRSGADIYAGNNWGCTCEHWVGLGGSVRMAQWLWNLSDLTNPDNNPNSLTSSTRVIERAVVSAEVRFAVQQNEGHTALHKVST